MDWTLGWPAVEAIATAILVAGIGIAIWQIIESRRSTNAQVAVELFKELRHKDILDTFREIYRWEPGSLKRLLASSSEDDVDLRHRVEGVLDKFELLGTLVDRGIIDESIAIEAYGGPPVLKCWYQLREYIMEARHKRGLFCKHVEDFAARTWEYQRKRCPRDEWVQFYREGNDKPINLIEEFEKHPELGPKRSKARK